MTADARRRDIWFALGVICLATYLTVASFSYPADSSGFPRFLSVTILVLASILLIRTLLARPETPKGDAGCAPKSAPRGSWLSLVKHPAVLSFLALMAYVALIPLLGFFSVTVLYVMGAMFLLGQRRWSILLICPVACSAVLYLIFRIILRVPIPTGLLI